MNTMLYILSSFLALKWVFDIYVNMRIKKINLIKAAVFEGLPRDDDFKFLAALRLYLSIKWGAQLYKNFFKPITMGRILTLDQRRLLTGAYTAPKLTPYRLRAFMMELKFDLFNQIILTDFPGDNEDKDSYEF